MFEYLLALIPKGKENAVSNEDLQDQLHQTRRAEIVRRGLIDQTKEARNRQRKREDGQKAEDSRLSVAEDQKEGK